MYLLVGLGNIGREYEKTRHNFGFIALDKILEKFNFEKKSNKFNSELFEGTIDGIKIIAIKPQTYMNRSGIAVLEITNFYKIPSNKIIVLHDEIDIEFGKIKMKIGGGNAGHNGLRSIDEKIGNNYWRIRIGVSRPKNPDYEIADYVLSNFNIEEIVEVEKISDNIVEVILNFLKKNIA